MISHLALIMDGNRRWAKQRGMPSLLGHRQGVKAAEMIMEYCLNKKIPYLSLYTFSLENFNRTQQEISYLFKFIHDSIDRVSDFIKKDVRIRFIGDLSLLPDKTKQACTELMAKTEDCKQLTCNLLVCYGGQQEIISSVQRMMDDSVTAVDKETFKQYLWMGNVPDPEVVIRTGGVKRLSNFLLFQLAYAEIRFLDCLWPDLTHQILDETIQNCLHAQKNFGK